MISAGEALAAASKQTGLADFGDDRFREGLEIYCQSVTAEAELNEIGTMAVEAAVVGNLANRLRVVNWADRHPEVAEEAIVAPLVVIGMFRAGTTLLSNLLDQDPKNRPLLRWEAGDCVPPATPSTFRRGPRVEAARAGLEMLERLNPMVAVVHHEEADGPTECISVMMQDFKSLALEAVANVPAYGTWLQQVDQRSAYEHHRLVLQVLQSAGVRGRWTLKSPHHAIALEALTAVYPDARLVVVHRDPVMLCASVCSLIQTLSGGFSDADHRAYIAEHWTGMLELSVARLDAFRAARPGHPLLDLNYEELVRDPVQSVARIYDFCGEPLGSEAKEGMSRYLKANPRDRFGQHRYDLADFGLSGEEVAERFAGYRDRYLA